MQPEIWRSQVIFAVMALISMSLYGTAGFGATSPGPNSPELRTVAAVDLTRYMGQWYEIASFPQRFQKGCAASKAIYTLRPDGKVQVINECRDKTLDGKLRKARGTAWVVDRSSNAKLKVRFFWPFSGDYWIIDLGSNYEYAVVGHPKRSYLWILSRTPQMEADIYEGILDRLKAQGYDIERLVRTLQPRSPERN